MSFFVNASQEEAFRLVMDYVEGRNMKILTSNSPSYVKVRFGSWTSWGFDNTMGVVETKIAKKDGGSYLNLYFGFRSLYLVVLVSTIFMALLFSVFAWAQTMTQGVDFLWGMMWTTLIVSIYFGLIGTIAAYSTSKTRRRIIEEFNMFIQSLASKKD